MTTKEFLIKTKEVLMTRGWCRKQMTNDAGHVCLVGAMRVVETGNPAFWVGLYASEAYRKSRSALEIKLIRLNAAGITSFNDEQTNVQPILKLLDLLIKECE